MIIEGNYWGISDYYQEDFNPGSEWGTNLLIMGDTIINDTIYKVIVDADYPSSSPSSQKGFVREDSTGKVFVRENIVGTDFFYLPNSSCPNYTTGQETLYYDFGMQVGEQRDFCIFYIEITSIDSVLINGNIHRRLNMTHNMVLTGEDSWIEGIGSLQGFQGFFTYEFENNTALLCFKNDSLTFINPEPGHPGSGYVINENCDILNSIEEISSNQLKIHPNPVSSIIHIDYPNNSKQTITITNVFGQIVSHQEKRNRVMRVDVNDLTKGIYWLSLFQNDKIIAVRKFVKS
jgi:hypothetical protein